MTMQEIKNIFESGGLLKKPYWTIMREKLCVLLEVQGLLKENKDCERIYVEKNAVILEKTNGVKVRFDFNQTFSRAEVDLVMGKDQEMEEIDILGRLISQNRENAAVLDIGANIGLFSLELIKRCPDSFQFHLFEPIPETYNELIEMLRLNKVDDKKLYTYNIGISDSNGSFDFYQPAANGAASLRPIEDEFWLRESKNGVYTGKNVMKKVTCKTEKLDDFCKKNNIFNIGFMKIDVEGNEKNVLVGAKEIISRDKPIVYCELLRKHSKRFGYHPNDVLAMMKNLGYKCFCIRDNNLYNISTINDDTSETNFIFMYENSN